MDSPSPIADPPLSWRQKGLQILKKYWWVYPLWWVIKLTAFALLGASIFSE